MEKSDNPESSEQEGKKPAGGISTLKSGADRLAKRLAKGFARHAQAHKIGAFAAYQAMYGVLVIIMLALFPSMTDVSWKAINEVWQQVIFALPLIAVGVLGALGCWKRNLQWMRWYWLSMPAVTLISIAFTQIYANLQCDCNNFLQCSALQDFAKRTGKPYANKYPHPDDIDKIRTPDQMHWQFPPPPPDLDQPDLSDISTANANSSSFLPTALNYEDDQLKRESGNDHVIPEQVHNHTSSPPDSLVEEDQKNIASQSLNEMQTKRSMSRGSRSVWMRRKQHDSSCKRKQSSAAQEISLFASTESSLSQEEVKGLPHEIEKGQRRLASSALQTTASSDSWGNDPDNDETDGKPKITDVLKSKLNDVLQETEWRKQVDLPFTGAERKTAKEQNQMSMAEWHKYLDQIYKDTCKCDPTEGNSCNVYRNKTKGTLSFWCYVREEDAEACRHAKNALNESIRLHVSRADDGTGNYRLWTKDLCKMPQLGLLQGRMGGWTKKSTKKQKKRLLSKCKCSKSLGYRVTGHDQEKLSPSVITEHAQADGKEGVLVGHSDCRKWFKENEMRWCVVGFDSACTDRKKIQVTKKVHVWTSSVVCQENLDLTLRKPKTLCTSMRILLIILDSLRYIMVPPMLFLVWRFMLNRCNDAGTNWGDEFAVDGFEEFSADEDFDVESSEPEKPKKKKSTSEEKKAKKGRSEKSRGNSERRDDFSVYDDSTPGSYSSESVEEEKPRKKEPALVKKKGDRKAAPKKAKPKKKESGDDFSDEFSDESIPDFK